MLSTKEPVDKQKILDKVSEETNISPSEVKRIWKFQYEQMAEHIKSENKEKFRILGIGHLIQKHEPKKKINHLKDFEL